MKFINVFLTLNLFVSFNSFSQNKQYTRAETREYYECTIRNLEADIKKWEYAIAHDEPTYSLVVGPSEEIKISEQLTKNEFSEIVTQWYLMSIVIGQNSKFNAQELSQYIKTIGESMISSPEEMQANIIKTQNIIKDLTDYMNRYYPEEQISTSPAIDEYNNRCGLSYWVGSWSIRSKHTDGLFKGSSVTSKLQIKEKYNQFQVFVGNTEAQIINITPNELTYRVLGGGNDVTTRFTPVSKTSIHGVFLGKNVSSKKSIEGIYDGMKLN